MAIATDSGVCVTGRNTFYICFFLYLSWSSFDFASVSSGKYRQLADDMTIWCRCSTLSSSSVLYALLSKGTSSPFPLTPAVTSPRTPEISRPKETVANSHAFSMDETVVNGAQSFYKVEFGIGDSESQRGKL